MGESLSNENFLTQSERDANRWRAELIAQIAKPSKDNKRIVELADLLLNYISSPSCLISQDLKDQYTIEYNSIKMAYSD